MSRSCIGSPNQRGSGPPLPIVRQQVTGIPVASHVARDAPSSRPRSPPSPRPGTASERGPYPPRGGRLADGSGPRSSRANGV